MGYDFYHFTLLLCCCCCCQVASVVSNSVQPHRWQPTRPHRPWDSPGKNTGVGCHFLLQCMKVKSESEVAQLCPTLSDPMDCSLQGSSVHGIFQARVLEWGAIAAQHTTNQWHGYNTTAFEVQHILSGYNILFYYYECISIIPKQQKWTSMLSF